MLSRSRTLPRAVARVGCNRGRVRLPRVPALRCSGGPLRLFRWSPLSVTLRRSGTRCASGPLPVVPFLGTSMKPYFVAVALLGLGDSFAAAQWEPQTIQSEADFRGLCVVSPKVAWVSGTKGTFGRTTDAGKTWSVGTVPGADKLDFRAVRAFGELTAYLLSAGPGEESRIYKTTDGGKTWALQFKNDEPKAFFDALDFWDEKHGLALSDPVD